MIRAHKGELLAALAGQREPSRAHDPAKHAERRPAPDQGTDCMRCANLGMRAETYEGTRRVFWWRCARGHALMEGRNYGERVLLAPATCDEGGDFTPWREGQR